MITTLGFISTKAVLQETASSQYLTYNSEPAFKLFRNIQMWEKGMLVSLELTTTHSICQFSKDVLHPVGTFNLTFLFFFLFVCLRICHSLSAMTVVQERV